jgi:hypothetical protein
MQSSESVLCDSLRKPTNDLRLRAQNRPYLAHNLEVGYRLCSTRVYILSRNSVW